MRGSLGTIRCPFTARDGQHTAGLALVPWRWCGGVPPTGRVSRGAWGRGSTRGSAGPQNAVHLVGTAGSQAISVAPWLPQRGFASAFPAYHAQSSCSPRRPAHENLLPPLTRGKVVAVSANPGSTERRSGPWASVSHLPPEEARPPASPRLSGAGRTGSRCLAVSVIGVIQYYVLPGCNPTVGRTAAPSTGKGGPLQSPALQCGRLGRSTQD